MSDLTFKEKFPELNDNQIKMLQHDIEQIIELSKYNGPYQTRRISPIWLKNKLKKYFWF